MDPVMAQFRLNYFKDKLEKIDNAPSVDPAFVDSLKEVLRNQVPTAWHENQTFEDLYRTAIQCVYQINLFHPENMGRKDDKGSLLAALLNFASQAEVICNSKGIFGGDADLEELCLKVAQIAKDTANYYGDNIMTKKIKKSPDKQDIDMDTNNNGDSGGQDSSSSKASKTATLVVIDPVKYPEDHVDQYEDTMRSLCFDVSPNFKWLVHTFRGVGGNQGLDATTTRLLYRELAAYKSQLPAEYASSIIVRACEAHMDLLRACIVGPEGTPYAHGLFFFDIGLQNYPQGPPQVQLLTGQGKYRLNPNLYQDGKVCLSLLGTWSGPGWEPGKSTLLQVLLSIQGLILVPDPYFNEPGYEISKGTPQGDQRSEAYTKDVRIKSLKVAVVDYLKCPQIYPEFEDVIRNHFTLKRKMLDDLFRTLKIEGQDILVRDYERAWEAWDKEAAVAVAVTKKSH